MVGWFVGRSVDHLVGWLAAVVQRIDGSVLKLSENCLFFAECTKILPNVLGHRDSLKCINLPNENDSYLYSIVGFKEDDSF